MLNLTCALILSVLPALAVDVSGTWQLIVDTNQGTGSPTVVFQQIGEELTGTFSSHVLGESSVTGTVRGNQIAFQFSGEVRGQTVSVSYKGVIQSPTSMKGTAIYEGFDVKATWSGKKK